MFFHAFVKLLLQGSILACNYILVITKGIEHYFEVRITATPTLGHHLFNYFALMSLIASHILYELKLHWRSSSWPNGLKFESR